MENTGIRQLPEEKLQEEASAGHVTGTETAENQPMSSEKEKPSFQQLIENEYRQEYEAAVSQRIQSAIQQRFRNHQDYKAKWEACQPVMEALKERYGDPAVQPEEMAARLREDAARLPMAQTDRSVKGAALRGHFTELIRQAGEMKRDFPDFDLMRELSHPVFLRLTAPGRGVSVKDAFYAVHGEELQRDSMRYTAQQVSERIAASVRAGASRPLENGMLRQNPVSMGVDIAHMDKKTREQYRQRIRSGETINFRDKI